MQASDLYAKAPQKFTFGDDFPLFWKRFQRFVADLGCAKKSQFDLLVGFLYVVSFRRVDVLTFTDDHKTDGYVDISEGFTLVEQTL